MAAKLGILAGEGLLPGQLIDACRSSGRDYFVIAFEGHADPAIIGDAPHMWARVGAAGRILRRLRAEGVRELVLAGPVHRPSPAELWPDTRAIRFLASGVLRRGDDGLLSWIVQELEEGEGFSIVGADEVLPGLRAAAGVYGRHRPDDAAETDIARGVAVARALGRLDVGQAVVVQRGIVLGVEAVEGTDALVQRCRALCLDGPGGVLVKVSKPSQERRVDLPTVGPRTIELSADSGLRGVAIHAGETLVIERERLVRLADDRGLFVVGIDPAAFDEAEAESA